MNYLVVRPYRNGFSSLTITEGDTQLEGQFESWALNSGKRLMFVNNRMHKQLQSHYMTGSYQDQAAYAYSYAEMCDIIESFIGINDRKNYEFLLAEQQEAVKAKAEVPSNSLPIVMAILDGVLLFGIKLCWLTIKLVGFLLIIPVIFNLLKNHK